MRFQYALVTFLLALSSAERIAGRDALRRRQDNNDVATTSNAPASSTNSGESPSSTPATTESASRTNSDQNQGTKTASRTGDATSTITSTGTASDAPTSTATLLPGGRNSTSSNDSNPLPIIPKLNPPLGVAGVIMMLAGLTLAFIGIKNRQVQIFISTALLVGLGIEVLIVYLMQPPVPVGIQGAYLVAGVLGGLLVAGGALVFPEMSEGFGCILGGFCFSMWLLVLAPGGLVQNSAGKIILIAVFCVTCYCLYISRFTRVPGLIFSTAFAGSTAFIIGLDCFTRAGLKEFWLYVWNLNNDIFPLFTNTYPITRPIRAEVAAIVIIAFMGAMSQMKIWKVVKEQKQRRDAQRLQDEEARDALEEETGRRVEMEDRDARAQWEEQYDGKKMPDVQIYDSGVGSIDEDYNSTTTSHRRRSYPLVQIRPTTSEQNLSTVHQSSSTVNLLPQDGLKTTPSLPELNFNFDIPRNNETTGKASSVAASAPHTPPIPSSPATPGLEVPGETIKDRRNIAMKRLSLRSLKDKAALEAAEDEEVASPPEEESVIGTSVAATAPDGVPDDLSIQLASELGSNPDPGLYQHQQWTPEVEIEEPVMEEDNEDAVAPRKRKSLLSLLSSSGRRPSSSSRRLVDAPPTPGLEKKSDAGSNAGAVEAAGDLLAVPTVELVGCLPKKGSKVVRNHRINEWAKGVSEAEHEPFEELNLEDPEAVHVETGDAAEAARADENNAAPPAPTPPPAPKPVVVKDSKSGTVQRTSVAAPTPIYSHKTNGSEDSWSVPLAKRSSSAQLLRTEAGSTPLNMMRNVSAPILEQPLVTSPIASPEEIASSRDNRLSTLPDLPNLMDARQDRIDKRLTSTSFMRPNTSLGVHTPPKSMSNDSKEGSRDGSQSGQVSATNGSDTTMDGEDMTLAARKALVQRQSQLQAQNAEMASRPLNSRQVSSYGFPQVIQPQAARISTQSQVKPIYDSHQPRRMSSHDVSKQAQNWNQWRTSQQVASNSRNPYMINDNQQDMLRAMRTQTEHEARLRQRERESMQQQLDTHARMGGLNQAHAKALSRMQSQANKNAK
ncbi:hypothetical protein DOTSEDRAFT_72366 [Dothistroma septosporum NZE10]|uniref:TM7S3/TM198-like domain-containing protein n=1 Tax=Dothistroma septosporum (strain NZE10 / CBS 128990) TaxID=675120 RepID=M2YLY4_DOTSN|nr:hypothetical protein DOTSEDRAFT_72366 [Dothistroma septosporum NZE10]